MEQRIFKLNLNERPFEAIKAQTKTIEVRANKNQLVPNSVNLMRAGDTIVFKKNGTNKTIECLIKRVTLYKSVRELLTKEDINQTLSSGKNLEEGIESIDSIADYRERIAKNGVFAIALEVHIT